MAKIINFGRARSTSIRRLKPGNYIQFRYKGKFRNGIIVSPDWNDGCDCYSFKYQDDIPIELVEWIENNSNLREGDLFVDFGNEYDFRTFKHDEMLSIRVISFKVIEEEEKENVEEEVEDLGLNELIPEDSFEIGSSNRNLDSGTIYE